MEALLILIFLPWACPYLASLELQLQGVQEEMLSSWRLGSNSCQCQKSVLFFSVCEIRSVSRTAVGILPFIIFTRSPYYFPDSSITVIWNVFYLWTMGDRWEGTMRGVNVADLWEPETSFIMQNSSLHCQGKAVKCFVACSIDWCSIYLESSLSFKIIDWLLCGPQYIYSSA